MAGQRQSTTLDVDSEAFLRGLRGAVSRMTLDGERGLLRLGLRVQNEARKFCPVDTGRLRSSIQHVPGRDDRGPYVDVGSNVKYAPFIEFGTFRAMAQPYLRPALAAAVGYAPAELAGSFRGGV